METRLVRVRDIERDDEDAWRRLAERAVEANPFAEPDFFISAARHFESYRDATLVIAQDGSEFIAALPIAAIDRPRIPPRRVASTAASPLQISGLQTPLVDRTQPDRAVDALIGALSQAAKDDGWPGIVLFDEIGSDGPVAEALRRACQDRRFPIFVKDSWERATVSRSGHWANPIDGKRRREIGRRQRLLAAEAGAEVALVDRTSDPTALDDFLHMEISGWKGREGGHAFARYPSMAAWFGDWHRCLLTAGRVTVLSINVGPVPIAMDYFVRAGEGFFCFRVAFDESYATYGPGAMLLASGLNLLRDSTDAQWVDSMTSKDNTFFLGLLPERRRISKLLIGTGGTLDKAVVSALPAMTRLGAAKRRVEGLARGRSRH